MIYVPNTDTSNYELFKGLKISKDANIMNKYFGNYTVLYANFNTEKHIKMVSLSASSAHTTWFMFVCSYDLIQYIDHDDRREGLHSSGQREIFT